MKAKTISLAVIVLTLSTTAWAGGRLSGTADATVKACWNKSTGALKLRSVGNLSGKCRRGERSIEWAKTGAKGPEGPRGQRGPQGTQGIQGPQGASGDQSLELAYLSGSMVVNGDPVSDTVSFTIPDGTVVTHLWYRLRMTTPTGPCDALPEADSFGLEYKLNGVNIGQIGQTLIPGTTYNPMVGSRLPFGEQSSAILFPGEYDLATIVLDSNLVPQCWGTIFETQVFMETEEVDA